MSVNCIWIGIKVANSYNGTKVGVYQLLYTSHPCGILCVYRVQQTLFYKLWLVELIVINVWR